MQTLMDSAFHLRADIKKATKGLVGREQLAELIVLAAVAQEHLLVIGPPGTAKSAVVHRVAQILGGQYFEYLLGRFTEPSELFGPVDLRRLREGTVETDVSGMLPEADIVFLDEVFLGSTAILNTLLGVLNERKFRRGHTVIQCPLRICVGASNALPEDESLNAFADRFLIHLFIEPVADDLLDELLQGGWQLGQTPLIGQSGLRHLDLLCAAVPEVDMTAARPALTGAIRQLRNAGLTLSDRRIVKAQRLMAAAAVLSGRKMALESDLWVLLYVLPTQEAQTTAKEILHEVLASSNNTHLASAVELVSLQPLSRLTRLLEEGRAVLQRDAAEAHFEMERILREIDANFSVDNMAEELRYLRSILVARVQGLNQHNPIDASIEANKEKLEPENSNSPTNSTTSNGPVLP